MPLSTPTSVPDPTTLVTTPAMTPASPPSELPGGRTSGRPGRVTRRQALAAAVIATAGAFVTAALAGCATPRGSIAQAGMLGAGCSAAGDDAGQPARSLADGPAGDAARTTAATSNAADGTARLAETAAPVSADELWRELGVVEDFRDAFVHGEKGPASQRYVVLHDTDGACDGAAVVDGWEADGRGVAAHFVIDTDGTVTQCVPLDAIAHHAGYGDTGHDELFDVPEDGRDDAGPGAGDDSQPLGPDYADYGMNAHSIGVELVHVGDPGEEYPETQLVALDGLIAYLDARYRELGCAPSEIIDHKMWRTTNPDTSPEFADYLASYRATRVHGA